MDIYDFLEDNRASINDDYNSMMGSWNKDWSDETLIDFIKNDKDWYNLLLENELENETSKETFEFFLEKSFIKGGLYDFFEEIDIENGIIMYISVNEKTVDIFIDDCKKTLSFNEFINLYNDNLLSDNCN